MFSLATEPSARVMVFVDGQNLYQAARESLRVPTVTRTSSRNTLQANGYFTVPPAASTLAVRIRP